MILFDSKYLALFSLKTSGKCPGNIGIKRKRDLFNLSNLLFFNMFSVVGATGFEPATTRPPDAGFTGIN